MSDAITMSDQEKLLWRKYIISLLNTFINQHNIYVLALLLTEIYEYCAAVCENGTGHPVKFKSFHNKYTDAEILTYLHKLYNVRNRSIHKPYSIQHAVLVALIKDKNFVTILNDFFPDEVTQFNDLITLMQIK